MDRIMQRIILYLQLSRTYQYVKNGFVWLPLFFGYKLGDWHALLNTMGAFLSFCLAASSVYVINDLVDVAEDRQHPTKKQRPLPSKKISTVQALVFLVLLLSLSWTIALILKNHDFYIILGGYFVLNLGYSFYFKHIAIVDVVCIAIGFVLRVLAGGAAADVPISHWILIMAFLLAMFLAFAKRRDDCLLNKTGSNTRKCIESYNLEFISISMAVMASVIIVAYILYTVSPDTIRSHGTDKLYFTAIWVIVGILRYLQITFVEEKTGSPTEVFLRDRFLQVTIFLWIISFFVLLYLFKS